MARLKAGPGLLSASRATGLSDPRAAPTTTRAAICSGVASIGATMARSSGARLFQRVELALEQRGRHEVALASSEPRGDQVEVALEIDEPHVGALVLRDDVAVAPLQRRAGHHAGRAGRAMLGDPGGDRAQPRPAVLVGERLAALHLGDIGGRMETVRVAERAVELRGDQLPDGRLAGTRHAHHHDGANTPNTHALGS